MANTLQSSFTRSPTIAASGGTALASAVAQTTPGAAGMTQIRQRHPNFMTKPAGSSKRTRQRVVIVADDSSSMRDNNKAADAARAISELIAELAVPINRGGFDVARVHFSSGAAVVHDFKDADTLAKEMETNPIPIAANGGATNITASLATTLDLLRNSRTSADAAYLADVVILFSDGGHNTGATPESTAQSLKAFALNRKDTILVTASFGDDDSAKTLLKKIATSNEHFYECKDGSSLHHFLGAVGQTLSGTMLSQGDAAKTLGTLPR